MGFGDFSMGYLLGMSLSGPTNVQPDMTPGKCQADIDNENDPELIAYGEECYWKAWDEAYKKGVIEDLRNGKSILTWNKRNIYSQIDGIKQAELIERGELKIIALRSPINIITCMWANEEREEAKDPNYIALQASNKEDMKHCDYRII